MFEHIYFQNTSLQYTSEVVKADEWYQQGREGLEVADADHEKYMLDGKSRFLFGYPVTEEHKKALIYMQSFDFMESGEKYFTQRSNYASYMVLYTYKGKGELEYNGKRYELFPGDGVLIDCEKQHLYRTAGTEWVHSDLHFYGGNVALLYKELFAGEVPLFHIPNEESFQSLLEEVLRCSRDGSLKWDYLVSNGIEKLLLFLQDSLSVRKTEKIPENVRLLQQYMEIHFLEKLTIDSLAAFANMSKYHLIRQFSRSTGFTPHEYLVYLRLLYAENLLRNTDIASYRIGILSGFPTESNFVEKFKKMYGMTPGEYRSKTKHKRKD